MICRELAAVSRAGIFGMLDQGGKRRSSCRNLFTAVFAGASGLLNLHG